MVTQEDKCARIRDSMVSTPRSSGDQCQCYRVLIVIISAMKVMRQLVIYNDDTMLAQLLDVGHDQPQQAHCTIQFVQATLIDNSIRQDMNQDEYIEAVLSIIQCT